MADIVDPAAEAHTDAILSRFGSGAARDVAAAQVCVRRKDGQRHCCFSPLLVNSYGSLLYILQLSLTRGRASALRRVSFASLGQCWVRTSPDCNPRTRLAVFDIDGTLTIVS